MSAFPQAPFSSSAMSRATWRFVSVRGRIIYSCPVLCMYVHVMVPGQRLRTAKSCKSGTRVPDAIIETYQLREISPTENPRSSKVAGVEH